MFVEDPYIGKSCGDKIEVDDNCGWGWAGGGGADGSFE